ACRVRGRTWERAAADRRDGAPPSGTRPPRRLAVTPRSTIVVPTHERPAALAACLESLVALDYPREDFEVVVVDDGGRTPLEPLLDPVRNRLDVRLVRQERAGPAAARNAGAEHAQGDLLLFTDDDCR